MTLIKCLLALLTAATMTACSPSSPPQGANNAPKTLMAPSLSLLTAYHTVTETDAGESQLKIEETQAQFSLAELSGKNLHFTAAELQSFAGANYQAELVLEYLYTHLNTTDLAYATQLPLTTLETEIFSSGEFNVPAADFSHVNLGSEVSAVYLTVFLTPKNPVQLHPVALVRVPLKL